MPRYSIELLVEADSLDEAVGHAESAADFLGALMEPAPEVGMVCIWEPPEHSMTTD